MAKQAIKNSIIAIGCCAMFAACASTDANIYHSFVGQRVVGNEAYVTVTNVWNEMDALPLADKHCGQYGKVARYTRKEGAKAIFDCIPR
jgi:Fe-S cluster assembly scaffold protein SufB